MFTSTTSRLLLCFLLMISTALASVIGVAGTGTGGRASMVGWHLCRQLPAHLLLHLCLDSLTCPWEATTWWWRAYKRRIGCCSQSLGSMVERVQRMRRQHIWSRQASLILSFPSRLNIIIPSLVWVLQVCSISSIRKQMHSRPSCILPPLPKSSLYIAQPLTELSSCWELLQFLFFLS